MTLALPLIVVHEQEGIQHRLKTGLLIVGATVRDATRNVADMNVLEAAKGDELVEATRVSQRDTLAAPNQPAAAADAPWPEEPRQQLLAVRHILCRAPRDRHRQLAQRAAGAQLRDPLVRRPPVPVER